ncbi:hypothetical protein FUAX_09420 [Fulvitalea axinellae]|uniref:Guanylate cyclase domain-containing protein n=1 Tax=Fulvitalea axinellae TaxID=1182444 RepID=A0AAU9CH03_9BACT|nr:hypothetical protein FUAX_09420 [Fulvitalea axinellae]
MKSRYLASVLKHFAIWTVAFTYWSLVRVLGFETMPKDLWHVVMINAILGLVAGILFGSTDYVLKQKLSKNLSFGTVIITGSVSYFLVILSMILVGIIIYTMFEPYDFHWFYFKDFILSKDMALLLPYYFGIIFFVNFMRQVSQKFGRGNLWKMMTGKFHSPKEVDRVFMFLDLKSSTSIAEKLGHIHYSELIQDCFADLTIIENYKAEIYQYVGDEAVITWEIDRGKESSNCLQAFFGFRDAIAEKAEYYKGKYGLVPEFKAGLNSGKTVMVEVGEIKREIAYHGDAIITASRIQGECNRFGQDILVSEVLYRWFRHDERFTFSCIGETVLKGKTESVKVFGVEKRL